LSYYEDNDTINGDKITSTLTKDDVRRLANAIKKNPKTIIGFIVEDGILPAE